jgi:hypothetical protein
MAASQNPASFVAGPHRYELLIGSADLSARTSLFNTNAPNQFLPYLLLPNLVASPGNLLLFTRINHGDVTTSRADQWSASNQHRIQGPGFAWRIRVNPDWMERGLARMAFSIHVARHELIQLRGLDRELAQAFASGFAPSQVAGRTFTDDQFEVKVTEWDALALRYGLSWGKGKQLLHLAVGGNLLSVGNVMSFRAYQSQLSFGADQSLSLRSDSVSLAYNPSFARALSADGNPYRRWNHFEYSWGLSGEIGLIYQVTDYQRKTRFELGASVQNVGLVQYWNLTHTQYRVAPTTVSQAWAGSQLQDGVAGIRTLLDSLATDTSNLGTGITERLPLILTAHAKLRIARQWGLHLRGNAQQLDSSAPWETLLRATISYEGDRWQLFVPLSTTLALPLAGSPTLRPQLGIFISLKDRLVLGSNDVLTNLIYSSIRDGVTATHLFVGLHFPLKPEF